jgi:hypothetical protein
MRTSHECKTKEESETWDNNITMLLARYRTDCKSRKAQNVTTDQTKGYITKNTSIGKPHEWHDSVGFPQFRW